MANRPTLLDAALALLAAGIPVIPCEGKRAIRDSIAPAAHDDPGDPVPHQTARVFFGDRRDVDGIAIPCGEASGGIVCLDFDRIGERDDRGTIVSGCDDFNAPLPYQHWSARLSRPLFDLLVIERSPSGGRHVYFRCEGGLGTKRHGASGLPASVSILSDGGSARVYPTAGFERAQGKIEEVQVVSPEEVAEIVQALYAVGLTEKSGAYVPTPAGPKDVTPEEEAAMAGRVDTSAQDALDRKLDDLRSTYVGQVRTFDVTPSQQIDYVAIDVRYDPNYGSGFVVVGRVRACRGIEVTADSDFDINRWGSRMKPVEPRAETEYEIDESGRPIRNRDGKVWSNAANAWVDAPLASKETVAEDAPKAAPLGWTVSVVFGPGDRLNVRGVSFTMDEQGVFHPDAGQEIPEGLFPSPSAESPQASEEEHSVLNPSDPTYWGQDAVIARLRAFLNSPQTNRPDPTQASDEERTEAVESLRVEAPAFQASLTLVEHPCKDGDIMPRRVALVLGDHGALLDARHLDMLIGMLQSARIALGAA